MQRILTAQHLKTAMVNAFADHAMHVVRTRNMDHSIAFLRTLYKQVSHSFFSSSAVSSSSLSSTTAASTTIAAANASGSDTTWDNATPSDTKQFMSFKQYQERYRARSADNLSELFGQQLRQIHGCGASTAHAIVCRYGTLAHFVWHLRSIGRINALRELEDLHRKDENVTGSSNSSVHNNGKTNNSKSRLGSVLSKRILSVMLDDY
jgi:hypothetical protein